MKRTIFRFKDVALVYFFSRSKRVFYCNVKFFKVKRNDLVLIFKRIKTYKSNVFVCLYCTASAVHILKLERYRED